MNDAKSLYLDLMKNVLTNMIYGAKETQTSFIPIHPLHKIITKLLIRFGVRLVHIKKYNPRLREIGQDWPIIAHTMLGIKRLNNIQFCIENILNKKIPGDLIETGAWRGGAAIFMRAVLKAYGIKNRDIWVADSFEGFSIPNVKKYPQDAISNLHTVNYLTIPLAEVKENFKVYGLLDKHVCFLEGLFKNTLPQAPIKRLALIHADGDTYESTMDILSNLYPKLVKGGYIIVDDYKSLPNCRQAVKDYRQLFKINDEIRSADWSAVFWQRSG